jgi:hypothetical protein
MNWHHETEISHLSSDFESLPADNEAEKRAALKVVQASVYLALCSAEPEEIFAMVDATIMSYL